MVCLSLIALSLIVGGAGTAATGECVLEGRERLSYLQSGLTPHRLHLTRGSVNSIQVQAKKQLTDDTILITNRSP
jgi:hypothetical protein